VVLRVFREPYCRRPFKAGSRAACCVDWFTPDPSRDLWLCLSSSVLGLRRPSGARVLLAYGRPFESAAPGRGARRWRLKLLRKRPLLRLCFSPCFIELLVAFNTLVAAYAHRASLDLDPLALKILVNREEVGDFLQTCCR